MFDAQGNSSFVLTERGEKKQVWHCMAAQRAAAVAPAVAAAAANFPNEPRQQRQTLLMSHASSGELS
jgi:hypothetical protein